MSITLTDGIRFTVQPRRAAVSVGMNDAELLEASDARAVCSAFHRIKRISAEEGRRGRAKRLVGSFAKVRLRPNEVAELMISLVQHAGRSRDVLKRQSDADHGTYLDNAIWEWFTATNPTLGNAGV